MKRRGRIYQDMVLALPAKFVYRFGISPNFISVLCIFSVFFSSILIFRQSKWYLITLFLAVFLDMLDGTLARLYPKKHSGKLFDFFLDRFSDSMLILALMASGMLGYYFTLLLLLFYALSTLFTELLEPFKVRIYILSYRILTFVGLILQEFHPSALLFFSSILLINYSLTALFTPPRLCSGKSS